MAGRIEKSLQDPAKGMRILRAYEEFSGAATDNKRREVLKAMSEDVRRAVALLQPPKWAAEDDANLLLAAEDCRQLGVAALAARSPVALKAVALATFVDWLCEPAGPRITQDVKALYDAAHVLYEADEADWKIVAAAAPHLANRRYALAAAIYGAVYERHGEKLRPVETFAGLRLVRCCWEPKKLAHTDLTERPRTWQLLAEIAPRCTWDVEIEPEFVWVMRRMDYQEYLYAVEPYYRLVMANGSEMELRHQAALRLGQLFEWSKRPSDAARVYAQAVQLTENAELKVYYENRSRELAQKAATGENK